MQKGEDCRNERWQELSGGLHYSSASDSFVY